jgi:hypothetical protein
MKLNHSWEAASRSATQEFLRILRNPKDHHRVYKRPTMIPILSQISSVHIIPSYSYKIHLSIILSLGLPNGLFHSNFLTKPCKYFSSPSNELHVLPISSSLTWSFQLPCIFGEEHKLRSSSLCNFLQPHTIPSLFGANILLSTLLPNTFNLFAP